MTTLHNDNDNSTRETELPGKNRLRIAFVPKSDCRTPLRCYGSRQPPTGLQSHRPHNRISHLSSAVGRRQSCRHQANALTPIVKPNVGWHDRHCHRNFDRKRCFDCSFRSRHRHIVSNHIAPLFRISLSIGNLHGSLRAAPSTAVVCGLPSRPPSPGGGHSLDHRRGTPTHGQHLKTRDLVTLSRSRQKSYESRFALRKTTQHNPLPKKQRDCRTIQLAPRLDRSVAGRLTCMCNKISHQFEIFDSRCRFHSAGDINAPRAGRANRFPDISGIQAARQDEGWPDVVSISLRDQIP